MIYRYVLKTNNHFCISNSSDLERFELDQVVVKVSCKEGMRVESIRFDVEETSPFFDKVGDLDVDPSVPKSKVYCVLEKINDYFSLQIGSVVLGVKNMRAIWPEIIPQTKKDRMLVNMKRKRVYVQGPNILLLAAPESVLVTIEHLARYNPDAVASDLFMSGLEAANIINGYEFFAKALERLFSKERNGAAKFYQIVEDTCCKESHSLGYSVKDLFEIRHRCTHPNRVDHLSRRRLSDIEELQPYYDELKSLVQFALKRESI